MHISPAMKAYTAIHRRQKMTANKRNPTMTQRSSRETKSTFLSGGQNICWPLVIEGTSYYNKNLSVIVQPLIKKTYKKLKTHLVAHCSFYFSQTNWSQGRLEASNQLQPAHDWAHELIPLHLHLYNEWLNVLQSGSTESPAHTHSISRSVCFPEREELPHFHSATHADTNTTSDI